MKRLPLLSQVDHLENATALDPIVTRTRTLVERALRPRWLRDILHGVPLGHPLHPLGIHVPLGAWMSAALLDALPFTHRSARALIGVGVVGAAGTAVAGFADWSKLHEQQQRVGLVHAAANLFATALYAASFVQRTRGKHSSGKVLSYAGLLVAAGGGYLGGHLTYRQAAGVNHSEDVPHVFPSGWHVLATLNDIAEHKLERCIVQDVPLLVYRHGDEINVLSDTCSHLSAPLHEGKIVDKSHGWESSGPCVECPWHQSVFALRSGEVVHGPATSAQPRFDTRVVDGTVEVRLPHAG